MVKNTELRALAIKYRVTLSAVERDYAQNSLEGVLLNVPDFNVVFEQVLDELKKYAE